MLGDAQKNSVHIPGLEVTTYVVHSFLHDLTSCLFLLERLKGVVCSEGFFIEFPVS